MRQFPLTFPASARRLCVVAVCAIAATLLIGSPVNAQELPTCNGLEATIVGTEGFDRIYGTPEDDVIVSLGGRDVIRAGEGNDTICSGDGRDKVFGGPGDDWISGGSANDRLIGQQGDDTLRGEGGRDYLKGSTGSDTIFGGGGNDQLIDGGPGPDFLDAGRGVDRCEYFDNTMANWGSLEISGIATEPSPCGELDVLGRPILSHARFVDATTQRMEFAGYVTTCEPAEFVTDSVEVRGQIMWTGEPLTNIRLNVGIGTYVNEQWRELSSGTIGIDGVATGAIRSFNISWIPEPGVDEFECIIQGYSRVTQE